MLAAGQRTSHFRTVNGLGQSRVNNHAAYTREVTQEWRERDEQEMGMKQLVTLTD